MKYLRYTTFLLLMTFTLHLSAEYENRLIETLNIEIARPVDISPMTVRTKMTTKQGDFFSQTAFDNDLKTLAKDFDRIEPKIEQVGDKLRVTLLIWPKMTIRSIDYSGNRKVKRATLQSELGITPNTLFDRNDFNKAFHKLKAYYVKQGYFEAELEYDVRRSESGEEVDICILIQEGRAGKIKEICFQNFTKDEQTELLNIMCTKKYNIFLSWFNGSGTYNEEMIFQDKFMITNFLQNQGLADATVDIRVEEASRANRINVIITADRGPCYYFGEITFEGNTIFPDEAVRCALLTKPGCPYSPDILNETVRSIMNLYGRKGYIESYVNFIPKLDEETNTFSVHFTIEEGDPFCVGLIKVFGNCTTQTRVILHETLICPGEVFNGDKLRLTEERLRNIGYFSNVNVYAVKTEGDSVLPGNYRDVHIEVEETSTGHLGAFFGFSSGEDIFGGVNVTERNFNIAGFSRLFCDGARALRGGGEYAHMTVSVGTKNLNYNISWTKPYFMESRWTVGVDLEKSTTRYISDDEDMRKLGGTLHGSYQYNAFIRNGLHYRVSYSNDKIRDNNSKNADESDAYHLTSAIGGYWNYDSTNHPLKPTCGFKSRFEEEIAGAGGDVFFISFGYLNTLYYDLCGKAILKLRTDLRFLQPYSNTSFWRLPMNERFFLGGDTTIRGYRPYSPGPKFEKSSSDDKPSDDPAGGISQQFYSIELQKHLFARVDGFVYLDAGYLSKDKWEFGKPWAAAGLGIRFELMPNTPPVMVGYGWPFNPQDKSDVKRFFFQMGGRF